MEPVEPELLLGSKRKFSEGEGLYQDDSGVATIATPIVMPPPPITMEQVQHSAFQEELIDIQDTHLLRTYSFAQLVAGQLGISSETEMQRVWSGPIPGAAALPASSPTVSGLSASQFQELMAYFEQLSEPLNEELIGVKANARPRPGGGQTQVEFEEEDETLLERRRKFQNDIRNRPRTFESGPRSDNALGTGRSVLVEPPAINEVIPSAVYGKDLLRKLLLERSLSSADLEAVDLVSSRPTEAGRTTLKTVWGKVSFNASMANLTPTAMSSIRQGHGLVIGKSKRNSISLDQLVLGPRIQDDFSILVSLLINKSVASRAGTYRGSQQPQALWFEINLLMRKFTNIAEDDEGNLYTTTTRQQPRKRRKTIKLYSDTGEFRGDVVTIGNQVYKTGGGGSATPTPSYQARRIARMTGSYTPDYLTEALESI